MLWPDADEFICHRDFKAALDAHRSLGHTLIRPATGWQMYHPEFPADDGNLLTTIVRRGFREDTLGKPVIVNPAIDIQWAAGKHTASLEPVNDPSMSFLHFRRLGLAYHLERNHNNWARVNQKNRNVNHGWQTNPIYDDQQREEFAERLENAVEVPL